MRAEGRTGLCFVIKGIRNDSSVQRRQTVFQGIPATEVTPPPRPPLGFEALRADHGSDEGPHVEEETDPTGGHLDPEHRPASVQQLLNLVIVVAATEKKVSPVKNFYESPRRAI